MLACEPPKKKATVPPTYSQVFNKSCSAGTVQVSRKQAVSVKAPLRQGEAVIITGQMRGGSPCLSNSGFSFRCEGIVYVDTNRAFVCQSGYITPTNPGQRCILKRMSIKHPYSQTSAYPYNNTSWEPVESSIQVREGDFISEWNRIICNT